MSLFAANVAQLIRSCHHANGGVDRRFTCSRCQKAEPCIACARFVLRYYDMAVKDLERHLKAGWESIVVAAGLLRY
jgi:hypothetical protein